VGINRKVFYVKCIRQCVHGGVKHEIDSVKKFYSALKAKHFIQKAPEGCFEASGHSYSPKPKVNDEEKE
jgi:hypothetical protein